MSDTSAPQAPVFGESSCRACINCVKGIQPVQNGGRRCSSCMYCGRPAQSERPRPGGMLSIHPPSQYVTPDLESPQGPLDLWGQEVDGLVGVPCLPTKPAWDMDTLKRAICSARTGTGDVGRIIESCTFKPREQAFTALINMCGQLRDWRKAVEVFEAMKNTRGVRPNTYTYSALIAACSSAGEWQRALEFFRVMKHVGKGDPNCQPNEVTYSALITACERGGQFEKALEVYDDMACSGVCGDHITFSSALSACEKSGNWVRAERILQEMHAKGLSGDAGIYSEMMLNYAENGNWERALDMCLTMANAGQDPMEGTRRRRVRSQKSRSPTDSSSQEKATSARGASPSSSSDLACNHPSQQAHGNGHPSHLSPAPNKPAWDMETLKRAICFSKPGTGEVRRVIESCTFRPREQAFTALINMCGRLRDWRKAMEVFEAMKYIRGVRANTFTYSALIAACSSSGEWEKALEIFEVMKASAVNDHNCRPNEVTYSALITACQRGGMFDRALGLYDEMMSDGVKADQITFSSVLAACEKSERWDRVEKILEDMHGRGLTGNPSIYAELINYHSDQGDWSRALNVFYVMQVAGQEPEENTVKAVMRALERGKQHQIMLELFSQMQASGIVIDPETYNSIIRALVQAQAYRTQSQPHHQQPQQQQQQQQHQHQQHQHQHQQQHHFAPRQIVQQSGVSPPRMGGGRGGLYQGAFTPTTQSRMMWGGANMNPPVQPVYHLSRSARPEELVLFPGSHKKDQLDGMTIGMSRMSFGGLGSGHA